MHWIVAEQLQSDLENEPDRWTVRVCDPAGDIIWRNRAQRENYIQFGFVPTPTLRWDDCRPLFTPRVLARIEQVTRAAFATGQPVRLRVPFRMNGRPVVELCTYLQVFGHRACGVLAIHCRTAYAAIFAVFGGLESPL